MVAGLGWLQVTCMGNLVVASELCRHLVTHPGGELIYEIAFSGYCCNPLNAWRLHVSLNTAEHQELIGNTTLFTDACGYQMQCDFTLSNPKEEG